MPYMYTTNGIKLYYETYGEGKPIIFIHPPLMGHVVFKYQKVLSNRFQVILYDLRGHGKSGYLPSESIDQVISDHTDDLNSLIDGLNLKKPIIASYSNAGIQALDYSFKYPEKVGALVLSGGYPKVDSLFLAGEYQIGMFMMRTKIIRILSAILAASHKVTKEDQQELFSYAVKSNIQAVLDLYKSCLIYNGTGQLQKLSHLPMLVLYGTRDKFISKHRKYFQNLPKTQIVFIDKAFHQLPTKQYHEFNLVMERFLTDVENR
ncbi:alpha/beta hydrolase [Sporolactobacillus sp. THM7-4]|nr:alpha/beta hydrolase [Sporolactobacillus sp. THM7-4]